jgi:hypothetical protein
MEDLSKYNVYLGDRKIDTTDVELEKGLREHIENSNIPTYSKLTLEVLEQYIKDFNVFEPRRRWIIGGSCKTRGFIHVDETFANLCKDPECSFCVGFDLRPTHIK